MITDQKVNAKFVGAYVIGKTIDTSVIFATTHKPNWFQRFLTKLIMGWKWMSISDIKTEQKNVIEKKKAEQIKAEQLNALENK